MPLRAAVTFVMGNYILSPILGSTFPYEKRTSQQDDPGIGSLYLRHLKMETIRKLHR